MRGGGEGLTIKASRSCVESKRNRLLCRLHFKSNSVMIVRRKRDAATTDAIMSAKVALLLEKVVPGDAVVTGVSACGKLE